jgi:hypothetical protein
MSAFVDKLTTAIASAAGSTISLLALGGLAYWVVRKHPEIFMDIGSRLLGRLSDLEFHMFEGRLIARFRGVEAEQGQTELPEAAPPSSAPEAEYRVRTTLRRKYTKRGRTYYAYTVDVDSEGLEMDIDKVVYHLPAWFKNRKRTKPGFDTELRISVWGTLPISVDVYPKAATGKPKKYEIMLNAGD